MTAEHVFRALLRVYPNSFRTEYGDAMLTVFRESREDFVGPWHTFWVGIVADAIRAIATLWWDECRRSFALRWMISCATGLVCTAAVANMVAWAIGYLYHPYLEGFTIGGPAYGGCLGLVLGVTIARTQSILLPRQDTRSWALASAVAVPIAVLLCGTVVDRTLMGMNAIADDAIHHALDGWIGALNPPDVYELSYEFATMTLAAAVFAVTGRRRLERRHAS